MKFRQRITSALNKTFNRGPKETLNSFQKQSKVKKHGFTGTPPKPNKNRQRGRANYPHKKKKKKRRYVCSNERESLLLKTHPPTPHPKKMHTVCTMFFFTSTNCKPTLIH